MIRLILTVTETAEGVELEALNQMEIFKLTGFGVEVRLHFLRRRCARMRRILTDLSGKIRVVMIIHRNGKSLSSLSSINIVYN